MVESRFLTRPSMAPTASDTFGKTCSKLAAVRVSSAARSEASIDVIDTLPHDLDRAGQLGESAVEGLGGAL